jgi:ATP-dependent DNA ligase
MFTGNIGEISRAALEQAAAGLTRFALRLLTPVSPMLANSAEDTAEALELVLEKH